MAHLPGVQESVAALVRQGLIDESLHRGWHFFLQSNRMLPSATTIFIVALPSPFTDVSFESQGTVFHAMVPPGIFVREDESRAAHVLADALRPEGHRAVKASLALKTLAVGSGLARYGRNNITYVPGMGSYHRLIAFYSDCPCEVDTWRRPEMMPACLSCHACREQCPARSILPGRFLIRAERCRDYINAGRQPAAWLQDPDGPLAGCLRCQEVCPANHGVPRTLLSGPSFTADETGMIVDAAPVVALPTATRHKLDRLAEDDIYTALSMNLRALMSARLKRSAP
jgi:epoxyqueuosine reductase